MSFLRKILKTSPNGPGQPVIVVSGLPRSGTSMMMQMLAAGGIQPLTDQARPPDLSNPRGYLELQAVKQLRQGDTAWLAGAPGKAVKVISALLGYLPAGYRYKVLFMRRDMAEILASQRQMLIRRGLGSEPGGGSSQEDDTMAQVYTQHLAEVERWLARQSNFDVLYLSYPDLLQSPAQPLARLNAFLDGSLDTRAMQSVIDPDLHRERR